MNGTGTTSGVRSEAEYIAEVTSSHELLTERLIMALLAAVPSCRAIYRFGSWGTVDQHRDSDIDLALLPASPLPSFTRWEIAQSLAALAGGDVDLVDLLSASTVLRMQVIGHGVRLYSADLSATAEFEDLVFSSYARLNEERREILADIRRRGKIFE